MESAAPFLDKPLPGQAMSRKDTRAAMLKVVQETLANIEAVEEENAHLTWQFEDERALYLEKLAAKERALNNAEARASAAEERVKSLLKEVATMAQSTKEQLAVHVAQSAKLEDQCDQKLARRERIMQEERATMKTRLAESQAECERLASEMTSEMQQFGAEWGRKMAEERAQMTKKVAECQAEADRHAEEKARLAKNMEEFRTECEQKIAEEKADMERAVADAREECERKVAAEKEQMAKEIEELRADCFEKMRGRKAELDREAQESWAERERIGAEKAAMLKEMEVFREDCERRMAEDMAAYKLDRERKIREEKEDMQRLMDASVEECQRMALDKAESAKQMAAFRDECKRKVQEEKDEMTRKVEESKADCARMAEEAAEMRKQTLKFKQSCEQKMAQDKEQIMKCVVDSRAECERMAKEKSEMTKKMAELRVERDKKMAKEKETMLQKMSEFRSQCEDKLRKEQANMTKQTDELKAECHRIALDKAEMAKKTADFRALCERKMAEEKERTTKKTTLSRAEFEQQMANEKRESERRLAEARAQTEAQLICERQVTNDIRRALQELPPVQAAMEMGDLRILEDELSKWGPEKNLDGFGECRGVVEALLKLAQERVVTWRDVQHTLKDVLREAEGLVRSPTALYDHCQKLFRAIKEAQLTKMNLRRTDPKLMGLVDQTFVNYYKNAMIHPNNVHQLIVRKVLGWQNLGPFDFADLDICLRFVDRGGSGSEVFLSRAEALVQDVTTAPRDLKPLLSHVETMLFYLKYTKSEDLALCHMEFREHSGKLDRHVKDYLRYAEQEYAPGCELVRFTEDRDLMKRTDVTHVLEQLRQWDHKDMLGSLLPGTKPSSNGLAVFREIFYQWAVAMHAKFNLLVLPHHTQVVCLLVFKRFLDMQPGKDADSGPHALIAQVGTGEGKSMIVAALAVYIATTLRKKVHVVVDDETLLERDFTTFKRLFDKFSVPCMGRDGKSSQRELTAVVCVSEERFSTSARDSCWDTRVDPEADICYCEAKHVQSFYASIARGEKRDFEGYDERVLILDEVDALVIDEEPNEAFVYTNDELGRMATEFAKALSSGSTLDELIAHNAPTCPATRRIGREVATEWARGKKLISGKDFVYKKEVGRYCTLQSGRANPKAWSLALEFRNFQDGLSREIVFKERLFVMSRARVFRKYHRLIGLSGSIGSEAERSYLRETYKASFFEVPPFLKTCRGSPFHEPVPSKLGTKSQAVYVESNSEAQLARVAEVTLEARERVPVLVIARDRTQADQFLVGLRQAARLRGYGAVSEDMVRSLSRTLYEADPEQWKENLHRVTLPLGDGAGGKGSWRVTVTDRRGGRGNDYRVDDPKVDTFGGLLLVPTLVPTSQREWIQFLGRTARQDRRGQFCVVLCAADYTALAKGCGEQLPPDSCQLKVVETILKWGDQELKSKLRAIAALYNTGVRVNELCEEMFGRRPELLKHADAREILVDVCQRMRWMSVKEVNDAFGAIPGFDPKVIPTQAHDTGRPAELRPALPAPSVTDIATHIPKVVVFCLDWSASMKSRDTGTQQTRFEVCVASVKRILRHQVRENDLVGVVGFGPGVKIVCPPTVKGSSGGALESHLVGLQPMQSGGTSFFDAVLQCLQLLSTQELVHPQSPRWLVCLTDGDDLGSRKENAGGELVSLMLGSGTTPNLNMIMITVGKLKAKNVSVIDGWVNQVCKGGGEGKHLSEKDAATITKAFNVVADFLAVEVGGATEC